MKKVFASAAMLFVLFLTCCATIWVTSLAPDESRGQVLMIMSLYGGIAFAFSRMFFMTMGFFDD